MGRREPLGVALMAGPVALAALAFWRGRVARYYPVVRQAAAGGSVLNRLVEKVFNGSASMLLAQLVTERNLPPEELQRMRTLLDERLAGLEDEG